MLGMFTALLTSGDTFLKVTDLTDIELGETIVGIVVSGGTLSARLLKTEVLKFSSIILRFFFIELS